MFQDWQASGAGTPREEAPPSRPLPCGTGYPVTGPPGDRPGFTRLHLLLALAHHTQACSSAGSNDPGLTPLASAHPPEHRSSLTVGNPRGGPLLSFHLRQLSRAAFFARRPSGRDLLSTGVQARALHLTLSWSGGLGSSIPSSCSQTFTSGFESSPVRQGGEWVPICVSICEVRMRC